MFSGTSLAEGNVSQQLIWFVEQKRSPTELYQMVFIVEIDDAFIRRRIHLICRKKWNYLNVKKKQRKKKLLLYTLITIQYINNCIRKSWVTLVHFNFILNIISTLFYVKKTTYRYIESYSYIRNTARQQNNKTTKITKPSRTWILSALDFFHPHTTCLRAQIHTE